MSKAILINVENQTVSQVEVDSLQSYYTTIGNGCRMIQLPVEFENMDSLFCDEEICLRPDDIKGAFMFHDWAKPIVNNALILGCDDEGESVDVKTSVDEIAAQIRWFNMAEGKMYASHYVNTPPLIISWQPL